MRWVVVLVNAMSAMRLLLAAGFPLLEGYWRAGLILLVALSDGADGFIARRYNAATWLGGILDVTADKIFVFIVLGTYLAGGELNGWEVSLLILRDVVVFGAVTYMAGMRLWYGFKRMPARLLGKLTTGAMFLLILLLAVWGEMRPLPVQALLIVTVLLSTAAAADYLAVTLRAERDRRSNNLAPHDAR